MGQRLVATHKTYPVWLNLAALFTFLCVGVGLVILLFVDFDFGLGVMTVGFLGVGVFGSLATKLGKDAVVELPPKSEIKVNNGADSERAMDKINQLRAALKAALLWTDEENDAGQWREQALKAIEASWIDTEWTIPE